MRWLAVLLLMALGCTSSGTSAPISALAPTVNVADLQSKTVALVDKDSEGVHAYCSGVWVAKYTILTARHCVADVKRGELVDYVVRGDVYPGASARESDSVVVRHSQLFSVDEDHDLALLAAVSPPSHAVADVTLDAARAGQRVFTMGHPLGQMWSYSSGEVASIRYVTSHGHEILFVQATSPISGGNSGGGLFNDFGELVGVCHATFTRGQNMNLWIHHSHVSAFLKGAI